MTLRIAAIAILVVWMFADSMAVFRHWTGEAKTATAPPSRC
jgi:hypothetical protein